MYALILWLECRQIGIVDRKLIDASTRIGDVVVLPDPPDGKDLYDAKIVAFSEDMEYLKSLDVDRDTGNIMPPKKSKKKQAPKNVVTRATEATLLRRMKNSSTSSALNTNSPNPKDPSIPGPSRKRRNENSIRKYQIEHQKPPVDDLPRTSSPILSVLSKTKNSCLDKNKLVGKSSSDKSHDFKKSVNTKTLLPTVVLHRETVLCKSTPNAESATQFSKEDASTTKTSFLEPPEIETDYFSRHQPRSPNVQPTSSPPRCGNDFASSANVSVNSHKRKYHSPLTKPQTKKSTQPRGESDSERLGARFTFKKKEVSTKAKASPKTGKNDSPLQRNPRPRFQDSSSPVHRDRDFSSPSNFSCSSECSTHSSLTETPRKKYATEGRGPSYSDRHRKKTTDSKASIGNLKTGKKDSSFQSRASFKHSSSPVHRDEDIASHSSNSNRSSECSIHSPLIETAKKKNATEGRGTSHFDRLKKKPADSKAVPASHKTGKNDSPIQRSSRPRSKFQHSSSPVQRARDFDSPSPKSNCSRGDRNRHSPSTKTSPGPNNKSPHASHKTGKNDSPIQRSSRPRSKFLHSSSPVQRARDFDSPSPKSNCSRGDRNRHSPSTKTSPGPNNKSPHGKIKSTAASASHKTGKNDSPIQRSSRPRSKFQHSSSPVQRARDFDSPSPKSNCSRGDRNRHSPSTKTSPGPNNKSPHGKIKSTAAPASHKTGKNDLPLQRSSKPGSKFQHSSSPVQRARDFDSPSPKSNCSRGDRNRHSPSTKTSPGPNNKSPHGKITKSTAEPVTLETLGNALAGILELLQRNANCQMPGPSGRNVHRERPRDWGIEETELQPGSQICVSKAVLDNDVLRFKKRPGIMVRNLMLIVVGPEKLKTMSARGKLTNPADKGKRKAEARDPVPQHVLNAVKYYVDNHSKVKMSWTEYVRVINQQCGELRKPRSGRPTSHGEENHPSDSD